MDDFSTTTATSSTRQNVRILKQIVDSLTQEARKSIIEFNIDKTELIYFINQKDQLVSIQLEGFERPIVPKKVVKWLGIYLDLKLSFKEHINQKVAAAERSFNQIKRLGNTQQGLSLQAKRQLYIACINLIADYKVPIWWNKKVKKFYIDKFEKLQNKAL